MIAIRTPTQNSLGPSRKTTVGSPKGGGGGGSQICGQDRERWAVFGAEAGKCGSARGGNFCSLRRCRDLRSDAEELTVAGQISQVITNPACSPSASSWNVARASLWPRRSEGPGLAAQYMSKAYKGKTSRFSTRNTRPRGLGRSDQ